ncbi:hypothetical protein COU37_03280 [Candidatus Micrarchaeota archaeon CG10_big_fil_rev_8_21_14_0_10_45_29]|nr:MAG: hypothetical protein COU37_03280 [Candidatus Micrarchaeota archaeon CG10_big_fil_rev_8_21_14_0_10_45_29]
MSKKGNSPHTKRISLPKTLPVAGRKEHVWIASVSPGTHARSGGINLLMLLRDELSVCANLSETKRLLNSGGVLVDGQARKDARFPVGIMDIISILPAKKAYRMQITGGKLKPAEVDAKKASIKYCKVVGKRTLKKKKIAITLHDGRSLLADDNVKVGSTLKMELPKFKMHGSISMAPGAKCVVIKGKHAGKIAKLENISKRTGSIPARAQLKASEGDFSTLANYLVAVDEDF